MPTLPVDDGGTVLYYDDTGALEGIEKYVTIVLIHGVIFHGSCPSLCPCAQQFDA